MFGAKKNLFTSNYRCIRELLIWLFYLLSQNTKWRSKLNMELWLNDFWVLTSLLQQQKDVLLCGQHNVMIWRTWKTEMQNEYGIVFNSDTAQTLHHFLWKLLSSFRVLPNCIPSLVLNAFHLKKHNICVDKNLVELLPLLKRFCFFCAFVQKFNNKKNWRRRRQEICPVPVQSKKCFYSQQLLIILKKQNALVLFPEKSILNFLSSTQINEMFFVFFSSQWRAFSTSKRKLLRFVVFEQTFDHFRPNCSW